MNDIKTLDNLNISSYRVDIEKLPFFNYKIKEVDMPSFTLPSVNSPNPMQTMKVPGDHLEFDPLTMNFIIDENLYNYCGIMNWMFGLGFPNSFEDFQKLIGEGVTATSKRSYTARETSDITIHLLSNHQNSNRVVKFYNAFPTTLSGVSLSNRNSTSNQIEATVTFEFTGMKYVL